MNWLWTIGLIGAAIVAMELFVDYGERWLSEWLPNWKTEIAAWGTILLGLVVQLDPSLFVPLFGDSKYTGLAIAILGIGFRSLRQITFTAGSRVPASVAAAGAAQTLVDTDSPELRLAVDQLVDSPADTTKAENVVTDVIRSKRRL